MPEEILERITLSPYLKAVLEGFEELSYFQDKVQIIKDLIALQVEKKTSPFYPHPSPLEKYCSEEAEVLLHIFEMLQTEIEEQIKAVEATKKAYVLPELHLTYSNPTNPSNRPTIRSSRDAYYYLLHNWSDQIEFLEEFNILLVNNARHVLGIYNVSKGGQEATYVDPKVIFAAALKSSATGIVLAHNHPSGRLKPSGADLACTERLASSGKILGITILDHLIVSREGYFSFADEGLLHVDVPTVAVVPEDAEDGLPF